MFGAPCINTSRGMLFVGPIDIRCLLVSIISHLVVHLYWVSFAVYANGKLSINGMINNNSSPFEEERARRMTRHISLNLDL